MADRFVQQDAGPAGTEHDGHLAGRRRIGVQVGHGLVHGFAGIATQDRVVKIGEIEASTAARAALLALAVFLDDDRDRAAHQRPDVGGETTVRTGDQDHFVFAGERGHDLHDARIERLGKTFETLEQLDLGFSRQRGDRIVRHVQRSAGGRRPQSGQNAVLAGGSDGAHGTRGVAQGARTDVVGVGERGLFAGDGAHADALVDVEAARLDDAFIEAPRLGARILEIEVGVIDLVRQDLAEGARQVALAQRERGEEKRFGLGQGAVLVH